MQIGIKTMTGKIIIVDVEANQTIALVKEKIKKKEGIPVNQQRLILAGKTLEDERMIRDCHTHTEKSIFLVVRFTHG